MKKILTVLILISLSLSANNLKEAIALYDSKQYKKALPLLQKEVSKGSKEAIYHLGRMYHYGQGIEQNIEKAYSLYEKSALKGHATSQYMIGMHHFDNNTLEGVKWYEKAASNGILPAQYSLALNYYTGYRNLKPNYDKALKWAKIIEPNKDYFKWKNMKSKLSNMQFIIGNIYLYGLGSTEKNYVEAKYYLEKSSKLNNSFAQAKLGIMYMFANGVEEDFNKATKLLEESLKNNSNNIDALTNLGVIYKFGLNGNKDLSKSFTYYKKAANLGNKKARSNLNKLCQEYPSICK